MSLACTGEHEHIHLEGGTRCKHAQVDPRQTCNTLCAAISAQKRADAMNLVALDVLSIAELMSLDADPHDDPCSSMQCIAIDDACGDPLKPDIRRISTSSSRCMYTLARHCMSVLPGLIIRL